MRNSIFLLASFLLMGCGGPGGSNTNPDAMDLPPADNAEQGEPPVDVPDAPDAMDAMDAPDLVDVPADPPAEDGTPGCVPVPGATPSLLLVGGGFARPVALVSPPGDPRLFVLEQHTGQIKIISGGATLPVPFLVVAGLSTGNEQGLLGLAFHPNYATNGRFFVNYTDGGGDTNVVEYRVSAANPDVADPTAVRTILFVTQPASNHNGGNLVFGPDGFLYIGLGDGGGAGDPMNNGQNTGVLLGKMLRIDVDGATPYAIPLGNPFVGVAGLDEIWAYGLRNPWRYSFDRLTGDLYVGDVGQNQVEEVDFQPAASTGGENYGWDLMEGTRCYTPGCSMVGLTMPVHEYLHPSGCSITGGFVYRGCRMPDLQGAYFFADYCSGWVHSIRVVGGVVAGGAVDWPTLAVSTISSFGEDADGEIYIVGHGGSVYKIVP